MRLAPDPGNAAVPWFYRGESCQVTGLEFEDGKVNGIYVRVASLPDEILCRSNSEGAFEELLYGAN